GARGGILPNDKNLETVFFEKPFERPGTLETCCRGKWKVHVGM
ncbi:unnamed protein product, partial [Ectocarpus sp. 6 AP-2014]